MTPGHQFDEFITALKRLGLVEDPFNLSANPRYVYLGGQHQNIYYLAQSVITRRQGIALITGDVGIGKSSLARLLYNEYFDDDRTIITYIPSANWKTRTVAAKKVADALPELEIETKRSYDGTVDEISKAISLTYEQGRNIVLLVDESHLMDPEALQLIHELYNFDYDVKAVQTLMFGQPELIYLISSVPHLESRALKKLALAPLSYPEALEMVSHRLAIAGRNTPFIEDDAFPEIYHNSEGIPRNIVAICSNALDIVIVNNLDVINLDTVRAAIEMRGQLESEEKVE
jgi:type II secretory pathway predicted ATPase ExeA